jgi:hypothetical protein
MLVKIVDYRSLRVRVYSILKNVTLHISYSDDNKFYLRRQIKRRLLQKKRPAVSVLLEL